ncbi:MAG: M12 family metallopeptidase [Chloroflexota bacterium]
MPTQPIRVCTDRILTGEQRRRAQERAAAENPTNASPPAAGAEPDLRELALETRTLWRPGRTLRVHFLDGLPEVQAKVRQVAVEWMNHANIALEFVQDPNAEIRISFQADDGSWSYIGTDALGISPSKPTMNFGWLEPGTDDIEYRRVVLHEFGHALGCIHEHQHPEAGIPWDKDAVYRRYGGPPNNWSRAEIDHNLFARYARDQTQFSQFDKQSIMLYAIPDNLTIGDYAVGWNTDLSPTDKAFIAAIYPRQVKAGEELVMGAEPVAQAIGAHGEEDLFWFAVAAEGVYTLETHGWTDVVMTLCGPDDETHTLATDDDSGRFWNAKIGRVLAPGAYAVRVRHYKPKGTGQYRIGVRAGA